MKRALLATVAMAITCLAASPMPKGPRFVWNASSSVAPGLYRIHGNLPRRGQLALVQLPPAIAALALEHGYLQGAALLLKPVAATNGDRVCRAGLSLLVSGRKMADIRALDAMGRPLPSWRGCRVIGVHEVFLLSAHPSSFDSRYFGPIAAANIIGTAQPVWAWTPSTR